MGLTVMSICRSNNVTGPRAHRAYVGKHANVGWEVDAVRR